VCVCYRKVYFLEQKLKFLWVLAKLLCAFAVKVQVIPREMYFGKMETKRRRGITRPDYNVLRVLPNVRSSKKLDVDLDVIYTSYKRVGE